MSSMSPCSRVRPASFSGALGMALGVSFALAVAPRALAAKDPLAAAFKQTSRTALKAVKTATSEATKGLAADLKTIAGDYADETVDLVMAVSQAVDAVSDRRFALELVVEATTVGLAQDGAALLAGGADGVPQPGPDFQAGGGGVWDAYQAGVEKLLDKTDEKLEKTWLKFALGLTKAASKAGDTLDVRYRFPAHGGMQWRVLPPSDPDAGGDGPADAPGGLDTRTTQIFIAARFISAGDDRDLLELGFRSSLSDVDFDLSSMAGESVAVPDIPVTDGQGTLSLEVTPLVGADGFLTVQLELTALEGATDALTLSAPRVTTTNAEVATVVKDFRQQVRIESKFFGQVTGGILGDLNKLFASHLKALASGQVTGGTALHTGHCDMTNARGNIAFWQRLTRANPQSNAISGLQSASVTENEIPDLFQADACGFAADMARKFQKRAAARHAAITKKFDRFVDKVVKLSAKQGEPIVVNRVLGRVARLEMPLLSLSGTPPIDPDTASNLDDVLVVRELVPPDGGTGVSAHLNGRADPGVQNTIATTIANTADGTIVLGGLILNSTGSTKSDVPFLSEIPFLSQLFKSGQDQNKLRELLILTTPMIVTGSETE